MSKQEMELHMINIIYAANRKDNIENENYLKNEDDLKKKICPPHLREYYLNFFFDNLSLQQAQDN